VGVDDALALILAFHSPELEVQAVTGVNGNVPLDRVFENIQKMLALLQPHDKPWIARGADRPLMGERVYAHEVHGGSGLGEANLGESPLQQWWRSFSGPANELICKLARQAPGEFTLIALGPLTNVALALEKDPAGMKNLKEIIIMGGAVRTAGNITPHAEFNVFVDPLAAFQVLKSGLPITLIPLDITRQVALTPGLIQRRIQPLKNAFSKFVIEATGFDFNTQEFYGRRSSFFLHDPLAVGAAVCPHIVGMEGVDLRIVTEKGEYFGQTAEVRGRSSSKQKAISVGFEVNAEKFLDLFISRMKE
jgi:inosine-uridine nucleoside N-ribohydrolase